jgi:hypothetical protein
VQRVGLIAQRRGAWREDALALSRFRGSVGSQKVDLELRFDRMCATSCSRRCPPFMRSAAQPCLLCGALPADAHHIRFAQPKAFGRKVGDEFTVPLCRTHHRELHHTGNERAWWHDMGIDPLPVAAKLWDESLAALIPVGE